MAETEREGERDGRGTGDRQPDRQAVVQKRAVGKGQKIGQYRQIPTHSPPSLLECKRENMGGWGLRRAYGWG